MGAAAHPMMKTKLGTPFLVRRVSLVLIQHIFNHFDLNVGERSKIKACSEGVLVSQTAGRTYIQKTKN